MLKARYGDQWLFGKLLSGEEGLFMQVLAVALTCMCSDTLKVRYCEASS